MLFRSDVPACPKRLASSTPGPKNLSLIEGDGALESPAALAAHGPSAWPVIARQSHGPYSNPKP